MPTCQHPPLDGRRLLGAQRPGVGVMHQQHIHAQQGFGHRRDVLHAPACLVDRAGARSPRGHVRRAQRGFGHDDIDQILTPGHAQRGAAAGNDPPGAIHQFHVERPRIRLQRDIDEHLLARAARQFQRGAVLCLGDAACAVCAHADHAGKVVTGVRHAHPQGRPLLAPVVPAISGADRQIDLRRSLALWGESG